MQIKKLLQKLANKVGLEIHKIQPTPRTTTTGFFEYISSFNIDFEVVIDGGAAYGDWTIICQKIFPQAEYHLYEPLAEYAPFLKHLESSSTFIKPLALSDNSGTIEFHKHSDLVGSSIFSEIEGGSVDGELIAVPCTTLEKEFSNHAASKYLVKFDLQGGELLALSGCPAKFFGRESVFVFESNLFMNMIGSENQFENLVAYMKSRSFVLYDICGLNYRPLDQALSQLDLVFVHEHSRLRQNHAYASKDWREQQFAKAKQKHADKLRRLHTS